MDHWEFARDWSSDDDSQWQWWFANAYTNRRLRIAIATLLTRLREDNPQTRFDTHRHLWIVNGRLVYCRDCELRGGDSQWRFEIKRCESLFIAIVNRRCESPLQWRFTMPFAVAICNGDSHRRLRIATHRRLATTHSQIQIQSPLWLRLQLHSWLWLHSPLWLRSPRMQW